MTVVVGTAGHIDHGKTTLLRALTGIDADRLPEERRRGMTIDVGYAHLALPDGTELDFVDVPGHDRLVGNMLVGAGEIDAALLVVAADDGPRAQTREHLALLDALAIRHGIAVVTKADITGPERTAEVTDAVERLLDGSSLAGAPVLAVAAVDGEGVEALRTALVHLRDRVLADPRVEVSRAGSRLAIDRVFTVKGRGVVVTGTLRGRGIRTGTMLRLVPGDRSVRVREVQVHGATLDRADPGRVALNLAGIDGLDMHRGLVLTDDPAVLASDRILVRLSATLPDRARARVHLGTAAVDGVVGRSGRDALDLPDGAAAAILRLSTPIAVAPGDRLVLRRASGADRIVGALVIEGRPARGVSRRRQTAERIGRLADAVAAGNAAAAQMARLDLHGVLDLGDGDGDRIVAAADVVQTVVTAVVGAVDGVVSLDDIRAVAARTLRREATVARTTALDLGSHLVAALVREGQLVRDGATIRLPGTQRPSSLPDPELEAAMDRLERALAVPAPPALSAAARAVGCPVAGIRELDRRRRIVELEPDLAYATTTFDELAERAVAMASAAPLTPAAFRDATGTSRKYVMAILADLDRRGVLRRRSDGHVPGPRTMVASRAGES
jgi:selenocysteine-specific elongation factor